MSIINLFAINEQTSTIAVDNNIYKLNTYKRNLANPFNIASVCVKAFQKLQEINKSSIQEIEQINNLLKNDQQSREAREKKVALYYQIEKALKIIMEFRKTFCVSKDNTYHNELQEIDKILIDIHTYFTFALATYQSHHLKHSEQALNFLINFFMHINSNSNENK